MIRAPKNGSVLYEEGDHIYLIGRVAPAAPTESEIEEFAFGQGVIDQARRNAPNPMISWFGGHYVEGENPNANGAMWTAEDIAISHLTPMFMPVTVMHDLSSAVGLVADTVLKVPDKDNVNRSKIDTALALWKHRFPDVVEEAEHNYAEGSLMQSMECIYSSYDCSACGNTYHPLPERAEREHWCDCLNGQAEEKGSRILRGTCFTGSGLIFGTRGAEGADDSAHLESFQQEVAEFHREHASRKRSTVSMAMTDSEQKLFDQAQKDAADQRARADKAEKEREEAIAKAEAAEAAKATAETAKETAEKEAKELKEQAEKAKLSKDRLGALGSAFAEKIDSMPTTKERLHEQAGSLSDEDWGKRLGEIEEMVGVKRDAKKDEKSDKDDVLFGDNAKKDDDLSDIFTQEEVAKSGLGRGQGDLSQSPTARQSVVAGLAKVV